MLALIPDSHWHQIKEISVNLAAELVSGSRFSGSGDVLAGGGYGKRRAESGKIRGALPGAERSEAERSAGESTSDFTSFGAELDRAGAAAKTSPEPENRIPETSGAVAKLTEISCSQVFSALGDFAVSEVDSATAPIGRDYYNCF